MEEEIYVTIPGHDNYKVSNLGNVRNMKDRKLQLRLHKGYLCVTVSVCHQQNKLYLHRLVASAFLPRNPDDKPIIYHVDRNKLNNTVNNLRFVTVSEFKYTYGHSCVKLRNLGVLTFKMD